MENFIFIVYGIAVTALFAAAWAVMEVNELRKTLTARQIKNRLPQTTKITKTTNKPKSNWN